MSYPLLNILSVREEEEERTTSAPRSSRQTRQSKEGSKEDHTQQAFIALSCVLHIRKQLRIIARKKEGEKEKKKGGEEREGERERGRERRRMMLEHVATHPVKTPPSSGCL